jgi:hypothetical protein
VEDHRTERRYEEVSEPDYQEVETFNDFTGRAVSVGDEVVYAVRASSSLWLKQGKVEKIEVHNWETRGTYTIISRQDWKISVRVPGGTRLSFLETPSRIVKVRSTKEIELAEREAEFRAHPQRVVMPTNLNVTQQAQFLEALSSHNTVQSDWELRDEASR